MYTVLSLYLNSINTEVERRKLSFPMLL
uniref:Uncharacterized protein n=1 Tax=Anguilla anguilla TaxID=7936 RepID=A0A0E9Q9B2_ANGAN